MAGRQRKLRANSSSVPRLWAPERKHHQTACCTAEFQSIQVARMNSRALGAHRPARHPLAAPALARGIVVPGWRALGEHRMKKFCKEIKRLTSPANGPVARNVGR